MTREGRGRIAPGRTLAEDVLRRGLGARLGPRLSGPDKTRETLGLAIMSALSIEGLHSAICPSYFTMKTFASQPEARARAKEGLWISLGLSTAASVGIWFVFDEILPAVVAEAMALALFGISLHAISSPPPENIPPMDRQDLLPQVPEGGIA